jgi:hypothetical protein
MLLIVIKKTGTFLLKHLGLMQRLTRILEQHTAQFKSAHRIIRGQQVAELAAITHVTTVYIVTKVVIMMMVVMIMLIMMLIMMTVMMVRWIGRVVVESHEIVS